MKDITVDKYFYEFHRMDGSVEDSIKFLQDTHETLKREHPDAIDITMELDADIKYHAYGGGESLETNIIFYVHRPMTDIEKQTREQNNIKFKEQQRARDLAALEALKKKLDQ